jgi:glutathione S-transferase
MKLLGSLTSPYVRKVRVVMAEKKLDAQFVARGRLGPATRFCNPTRWARCPAW